MHYMQKLPIELVQALEKKRDEKWSKLYNKVIRVTVTKNDSVVKTYYVHEYLSKPKKDFWTYIEEEYAPTYKPEPNTTYEEIANSLSASYRMKYCLNHEHCSRMDNNPREDNSIDEEKVVSLDRTLKQCNPRRTPAEIGALSFAKYW